ncbi:AAA domain-containing protein [Halorubrum trueperi]|uniref:AAA domain-containing protein n=1 Tax=Halorubrum trueperi TaxID=2004704 RepID=A0ABD5UNR3_9EURY
MTESLTAMARAFSRLPQRPAVFDRRVRQQARQWWLGSPVDVDAILDAFREIDGFQTDEGRLCIPIHEPDSAELTGEFLLYDARDGAATVSFYEFAQRDLVDLSFEEFRYSYPAWRIRFWSPRTNPDAVPSYLRQAGDDAGSQATTQIGQAPTPSVERDTGVATAGDELFENLRSFVEREREAERESTRNVYRSMNRRAFFEDRNGVRDVEPLGREVGEYGEQIVTLHVAAAPNADVIDVPREYSLYPGSEIFIDRLGDDAGFPVEAELFSVDGRTLNVGVYWDSSTDKAVAEEAFSADSGAEFVVGELVNPVPFDRQLAAISTIESDDRKHDIVTGEKSLAVGKSSYAHVGGDLNRAQQTAARNALRAEDVYCIHGPPGTGKTRTLTEVIRAATDENLRVLACAHSNQAVDNLLVGSSSPDTPDPRSVHADAVDGDLEITRVGPNSTNTVVQNCYEDGDAWQADVVGATMSAASDLADDMFDIAVIDEATQATIPSTFIPFAKAETAILAGDHKQLPPYHSDERHTVEQPEFSLFEHLLAVYDPDSVSTTLTTQYRMHEDIAAFPNAAFYDGVLTHGQRNRRWTIGSLDPLVAYDVDGEEGQTPSNSSYNRAEAAVVAREVERLFEVGLLPSEIGVITPYDGQIGIIRSELNTALSAAQAADVKVNTIDSFQGSEREAVIVSFVRSNADGAIGFLDFPVEGPRRLNVALTRAQKRLVLVGNWDTLTADSPRNGESATSYYQSLRPHLESVDAFDPPPG